MAAKIKKKYPQSRIKGLKKGSEPVYEQPKTENFSTRLTPIGKKGFEQLAKSLGLSKSEIIEKLARGEFELVRKAS